MKHVSLLKRALLLLALGLGVGATPVLAQEAPTPEYIMWTLNNLWIMLSGALVFIMHLGFATLESGLTQSKNTVNILFKNTMIICIGVLTYALIGFNLMYPGDFNGFLSFAAVPGFISIDPADAEAVAASLTPAYNEGYTWYTDFFFQAMFAATAATIVSGAVAGRIKLSSFLVFATLFVSLSYPITGAWKWGGGWLDGLGFYDFAGSTLVHSVGGWGALVLAAMLGPRLGKYGKDGSVNVIPASNLPLAAIGVFLLWFGWFGFNGGSVLSADAATVSLVLVTTSMAAAAGGLTTGIVSWLRDTKPDLSMALNGILAGLVGITAGADQMMVWEAVVIGMVAGVLVYFSVIFVDQKLKIDDPVGAISVHLVCGIWGTLAVGIFGQLAGLPQLGYQLVGILAIGAFTVIFCLLVGFLVKATMGLRVDAHEETIGLDVGEHGMHAYPDFLISGNGVLESESEKVLAGA
ncbi:MAG: ammonium transporter [Bacteroidetes bacterium]|nr:MAG: ammonium transporter [Bacteroidota bacterium]